MSQSKLPMVTWALAGLMVACTPTSASKPSLSSASTAKPRPSVSRVPARAAHPAAAPTTLVALLTVFASDAGRHWNGYGGIAGISWWEKQPEAYAEGKLSLSGRMKLEGFSDAWVPNGKHGVDAKAVKRNEGQSGVTLTGTSTEVESIGIKKFEQKTDYRAVLERQLEQEGSVSTLSVDCKPEYDDEPQHNAFFRLTLPDGVTVYVEAYIEDGGKMSPGYTVFEFVREEPRERMQQLDCK